jgi:hypothetical protein
VDYFTFLAPEVLDDPAGATVRADMFSLGRLLQFLLSGSVPLEETTPVPYLGDLQDAPSRLVRIIRKCTARSPAVRYGSVGALLADIEHQGDDSHIGLGVDACGEASPDAPQEGPRRSHPKPRAIALPTAAGFSRARRNALLLATSAVLLLLGGLVFEPHRLFKHASARSQLSAHEARKRSDAVRRLVEVGDRRLDSARLRQADLSGLDLGDASLKGADLTDARLVETTLSGADLTGARLARARIEGADFGGCQLDGVTGLETAHCDEATLLPEGWTCAGAHPRRVADLPTGSDDP